MVCVLLFFSSLDVRKLTILTTISSSSNSILLRLILVLIQRFFNISYQQSVLASTFCMMIHANCIPDNVV